MRAHSVVKASKLEITVMRMLEDYTADVALATAVSVHEVAEEARDKLRHAVSTPKNFKGKKYRRSWAVEDRQTSTFTTATVYNKDHYRLTHLLEFGHQVKRGGRKIGEADEYVHIYPINEEIDELFQKKMEAILGKI